MKRDDAWFLLANCWGVVCLGPLTAPEVSLAPSPPQIRILSEVMENPHLLALEAHTTHGQTEVPANSGSRQPWVRVQFSSLLPITSVEPPVVTYRQTSE